MIKIPSKLYNIFSKKPKNPSQLTGADTGAIGSGCSPSANLHLDATMTDSNTQTSNWVMGFKVGEAHPKPIDPESFLKDPIHKGIYTREFLEDLIKNGEESGRLVREQINKSRFK